MPPKTSSDKARFEALHQAAQALQQARDSDQALRVASTLRAEMDRAFPGPVACAATPPMGVVIQLMHDVLVQTSQQQAADNLIESRWKEIDTFARQAAQGCFLSTRPGHCRSSSRRTISLNTSPAASRESSNFAGPKTYRSTAKINSYMRKWVASAGRVVIFSRDMSWAHEPATRNLLREKAQRNELTVCLEHPISLTAVRPFSGRRRWIGA